MKLEMATCPRCGCVFQKKQWVQDYCTKECTKLDRLLTGSLHDEYTEKRRKEYYEKLMIKNPDYYIKRSRDWRMENTESIRFIGAVVACEQCKKSFTLESHNKKFCSSECLRESGKKRAKNIYKYTKNYTQKIRENQNRMERRAMEKKLSIPKMNEIWANA
jgi:hypothetical protein